MIDLQQSKRIRDPTWDFSGENTKISIHGIHTYPAMMIPQIARRLIKKGAEGVALACTELPLLISGVVDGIKLYDTAKIHAVKALEYALE